MDLLSTVVELKMEKINMAGLKVIFRSEEIVMNELFNILTKSPKWKWCRRKS